MSEEVRVVDPVTGGEKGSKLERMDLLPPDWELAIAAHYGRGARKYQDRGWEKGYRWSLSYAALRRHLAAWWGGEDIDEETGSSHLLAVAWHAIALWVFQFRGLGTDDRPKGGSVIKPAPPIVMINAHEADEPRYWHPVQGMVSWSQVDWTKWQTCECWINEICCQALVDQGRLPVGRKLCLDCATGHHYAVPHQ